MSGLPLLDRLQWSVARIFPRSTPAFLAGIPTAEAGPIGPGWPARHAAARGVELRPAPDGGLIDDLEALRGPGVDPDRIAPAVRAFYEHTARYRLAVRPRWLLPFQVASWFWARLWARRWGQLELPLRQTAALTNEILDLGGTGTLWVRTFVDGDGTPTGRALYVSRYDTVLVEGEPDPCVRITFPVPGGAWVVLFRVELHGDRVLLTERGGNPGGPGLYLVPGDGPARYVRALREEIEVWPTPAGAEAEHRFVFLGIPILTLCYDLPEGRDTL